MSRPSQVPLKEPAEGRTITTPNAQEQHYILKSTIFRGRLDQKPDADSRNLSNLMLFFPKLKQELKN